MSDNFEQMWDQAVAEGEQRRKDRPLSFYGKLEISGRPVVFQAGVPTGKRDFDPDTDPEEARRIAVRIKVEPVSERATRDFEREFVVSSREGDMFRDSITAVGTDMTTLRAGPYVRVDLVEDTRLGTYQDRTTGAQRTRAGAVLREIFPDRDACLAASDARYSSGGGGDGNSAWAGGLIAGMAVPPPSPGTPGAPREATTATGGGTIDRKTAAKFLPGVWTGAGSDPDRFLAAMGENKIMQRHFAPPLEAPEVLAFLAKMGHPEYAEKAALGDNPIEIDGVPF